MNSKQKLITFLKKEKLLEQVVSIMVIDKISEYYDQKMNIAIDALEFYKKYSKDSRNFGLITTKIDEALEKLK